MNKYFNYCRICLSKNGTISIFENSIGLSDNISLCFGEKLEDCLGYPRKICNTCHRKLNEAVDFIRKYKKSCKILQEELNKPFIKEELEDFQNDPGSDNNCQDDYNYYVEIKQENSILVNTVPEINIESTQTCSKIVFGNAQQLAELIKPVIHDVKKPPKVIDKPKTVKKKKSKDQIQRKTVTKAKTKKSRKLKRNITINSSYTDKIISAALLEGKFVFNNDQWSLKKKNTQENNKTSGTNTKFKKIEKTSDTDTKLCDVCGEVFTHEQLKRHKMKHDKPSNTTCTICSKVLSDAHSLKRHMANVHATVKPHVCSTCGRGFSIPSLLKSHIQTVHMNIKREVKKKPCEYCGKLLSNNKSLLLHVRSAHTGERPAACTVCDARFHHEEYLISHMRLHTGETPYKCPVCGRGYAQMCNMKSHIKHNHSISQLDEDTRKNIHPRFLKLMKP